MTQPSRKTSGYDNSCMSTSDTFTPGTSRRFFLANESNEESATNTDGNISTSILDSSIRALKNAARRVVNGNQSRSILGMTGDKYFEPPSPYAGESGMINIRRPIYSQNKFSKLFEENIDERQNVRLLDNVLNKMRQKCNCLEFFLSIFPLINLLRGYSFKKSLPLDLLSGLTTGVMRIPQSMAYALLALLPPVNGLYTAFFSAVFYPIFGGSHHMAAGAQGVVSLIIGGGVSKYSPHNLSYDEIPEDVPAIVLESRIDIAITITFMVGIIQILLGIFRFGFLTNYLSDPLVGGFTTAAAVTVVASQLPVMLGIRVMSHSGVLNMWYLLIETFGKIAKTNIYTLLISVFCLVMLTMSKYLSHRYSKFFKIPIPGELLVMIALICFSYYLKIDTRWKVHLVGEIEGGFPTLRLPKSKYMLKTIGVSISAAIVSFAVGFSISKRMAIRNDYEINGNREMFAFGFMNFGGSFFNTFAATASMSATSLHESLGGVSQISNIIASVLILLAMLFLGSLFEPVPECVLSTVILINLKTILFQFGDLKILWKVSKYDFLLWIVTFLAVVILDIDMGLAIGVVFSLLTIVFRTQWPYSCLLGRIPSTDIYKNIALTPDAVEVTGIKIFRFEGSLYFASADHFRNAIEQTTGVYPLKIVKAHKERERKLLQIKEQAIHYLDHDHREGGGSTSRLLDNTLVDLNIQEVHHIIVDFSTCSFIDSVGVRTLMQVINDYKAAQINVFLANVRAAVRALIIDISVLYKCISTRHIFLSVHDAVLGSLEDEQYIAERNYIIENAALKSGTRCVSRIPSNPNLNPFRETQ